MRKKDFLKLMEEDEDWAPGWDIIDNEFERLYPNQVPIHYGTNMSSRAMFGGNNYLDGYSIYTSPKGYKHIVTYGMTELYANVDELGGEYNKWGYEMTFKVNEPDLNNCLWVIDLLASLARYTNTTGKYFKAGEYIALSGKSLNPNINSYITALLVINDTEACSQKETIYGRTDFLQFYGITEPELIALQNNPERVGELINLIKKNNPDFVTDMNRVNSYIQ